MNQPVVIKAILVIQYACAEETNRRRESSVGVAGPDITKHGKATHMRAMSMGIRRVVRGGQDSFFTSDIRRKKRVIRDDTAIQDADPWTIFRRRRWSGKIARSDLRRPRRHRTRAVPAALLPPRSRHREAARAWLPKH